MTILSFKEIFISHDILEKQKSLAGEIKGKFQGKSGYGLRIEKIGPDHFSGRLDKKRRIHFYFANGGIPVIAHFDPNHNYDESKCKMSRVSKVKDPNKLSSATTYDLEQNQTIILEGAKDGEEKKTYSKSSVIIHLDQGQEGVLKELNDNNDQEILVDSLAGNGKTVLALLSLNNLAEQQEGDVDKKLIYLTKSETLASKQKELFAGLYPTQKDKVEFFAFEDLLKQQVPDEIATKADFMEWYKDKTGIHCDKKYGQKNYPDLNVLYREFELLFSGLLTQEDYQKNRKAPTTLVIHDEDKKTIFDRSDAVSLFNEYSKHLKIKQKAHPSEINPDNLNKGKYDRIIIDEAQLFSKKDNELVKKLSQNAVRYFGDSTQNNLGDFTKNYDENILAYRLNNHYRSSNKVAKLLNHLLGTIYQNNEEKEVQIDNSASNGGAYYQVQKEISKNLLKTINSNPDKYCVIVKDDAKKRTLLAERDPEKKILAPIITLENCHGLEYENGVLFDCLEEDLFKTISKNEVADNLKQNISKRNLFLAASRFKESVTIVNQNHPSVSLLKENSLIEEWKINKSTESSLYEQGIGHIKAALNFWNDTDQTQKDIQIENALQKLNLQNIEHKITYFIKNRVGFLQSNPQLWNSIIVNDKIKECLDSYDNFLPTDERTDFNWSKMPTNLSPDTKLAGYENALEIILENDNNVRKECLKNLNYNKNDFNKYSYHLLKKDLKDDVFDDLLNFLSPPPKNLLKIFQHYTQDQTDSKQTNKINEKFLPPLLKYLEKSEINFRQESEADKSEWIKIKEKLSNIDVGTVFDSLKLQPKKERNPQPKKKQPKQRGRARNNQGGAENNNLKTAAGIAGIAGIAGSARYLFGNEDLKDFSQEDLENFKKYLRKSNYKAAKELIENRKNFDLQDKNGYTALGSAPKFKKTETKDFVKILLEKGANPNLKNIHGETALMASTQFKNKDEMIMLLENGADPNLQNKEYATALMIAADMNDEDLVRILLKYKADPDLQNKDGITALMVATYNDNKDLVRILLEYKANPDLKDNDGKTALIFASKFKEEGSVAKLLNKDIVEILLKYKANPNLSDNKGVTPLMHASAINEDIIDMLLENGAEINFQNKSGVTALMAAAKFNKKGAIAKLLEKGADPYLQNEEGVTALMMAESKGYKEIEILIKEKMAELELIKSQEEERKIDIATTNFDPAINNIEKPKIDIDMGTNILPDSTQTEISAVATQTPNINDTIMLLAYFMARISESKFNFEPKTKEMEELKASIEENKPLFSNLEEKTDQHPKTAPKNPETSPVKNKPREI